LIRRSGRASHACTNFAWWYLRIPTQGGQVFRLDGGHRTELMAATIPT
jgi:hypothetical protein